MVSAEATDDGQHWLSNPSVPVETVIAAWEGGLLTMTRGLQTWEGQAPCDLARGVVMAKA